MKIEKYTFYDGGRSLPNPSEMAMSEASLIWPNVPTTSLVSIGLEINPDITTPQWVIEANESHERMKKWLNVMRRTLFACGAQFVKRVDYVRFTNAKSPKDLNDISALPQLISSSNQKQRLKRMIETVLTPISAGHRLEEAVHTVSPIDNTVLVQNNLPSFTIKNEIYEPKFDVAEVLKDAQYQVKEKN